MAQAESSTAAAPASAAAASASSCPEHLVDDDDALSQNPMAASYGLTKCSETYDMLTQYMGSADLLCKSLGAGICNCTCAGTVIQPSVKVEAVPYDETVDIGGNGDEMNAKFDCRQIAHQLGMGGDRRSPNFYRLIRISGGAMSSEM